MKNPSSEFRRKIFAQRLALLVEKAGITHAALAKEVGVSRVQITQYISASRQPSIDVFVALAHYFDVSLDYLAGETKE